MRVRRSLLAALVSGALCSWPCAAAAAQSEPEGAADLPIAVSLGDSFISGEAGRWWGNGDLGAAAFCTRGGTDRAAYRTAGVCRYDAARVYGDTAVKGPGTGCHRSDVAEIHGVREVGLVPVNLACSGSETRHIYDPKESYKENKASQAELLRQVPSKQQVKLVVLSIGGNDLDVSGMLRRCADSYMDGARKRSCAATGEGDRLLKELPAVANNVAKAIDAIRDAMKTRGSDAPNYRLILQSYPSPVPTSSQVRELFPEEDGGKTVKRTSVGGCPLWNDDFDLFHDVLTPKIDATLEKVASDKGVEFLSMLHAVDGHALCEKGTRQAGASEDAATLPNLMEWVRFGTAGWIISQGDQQESFHPNAFAQRSQGRCLAEAYRSGTRTCSPG